MRPRLKSLELQGYKTFASRTNFEFPGVVTAIVGPNGSGKSNISDAIRWVLGEQSFSLLRGRKTEDMIFAGSEQRPRAGMAFATITFDNSDGWLPIDYSEVSITRRAYRDGQNEYLLNGQRVRLKEISELLAQSGLAERTYTIIGQGLVDAALSLKPEERRRFFEEAAGIGLYRSRKEESLNRLDATQRNLERVQDIMSELEPRLVSLERQAKRAMEYDRVKADLKILLRDWYGFHWYKLIQDVSHKQEVARVQEVRQQDAREKVGNIEKLLDAKRDQLNYQRNQLNLWHSESAEKHRMREKINRDLAVLEERERAISAQMQTLEMDLAHLEEEQTNRKIQIEGFHQQAHHISKEVEDALNQSEKARSQLADRLRERSSIEVSIRDIRNVQVKAETSLMQMKVKLDELANRSESLAVSMKKLQIGLNEENAAVQVSRVNFLAAEKEFTEAQVNLSIVRDRINDQKTLVREVENHQRILSDELAKIGAEKTSKQTQLNILLHAERSAEGLSKGSKYVLNMFRSGKLKGRYQALADLLEVPEEFEMAIAAVLGDFIDGIVYTEAGEADLVLNLLDKKDNGRAILIPSKAKESILSHSIDDPDFLGIAKDFVICGDHLEQVIALLLGSTLIVRDRQAAKRLVEQVPAESRIVTLNGEVFWGNGVISAGIENRSGIIARSRIIKELKNAILQIESDQGKTQRELQKFEHDLDALFNELKKNDDLAQKLTTELNKLERIRQQAVLAQDQSSQRLLWIKEQISSAEGRISITIDESKVIQKEILGTEAKIIGMVEAIRQLNRELIDLPLDDLQQQVNFWQTNAAVAERAMKDIQQIVEAQEKVLHAGNTQIELAHKRIHELNDGKDMAASQSAALHAQESQLNQVIEELQSKIMPAERALESLESEFEKLQGDHLSAQQTLTLGDRLHTQAQLELARGREAMEALRRRIEDDFGLVSLDYNSDVIGPKPLPFEGMVEQLPTIKELPQEFEENIGRQKSLLRRMGAINPDAQQEFKEVKDRFTFLKSQLEDLRKADADLRQVIIELDDLMQKEFIKTFEAVAIEFRQNFSRLFGGGSAHLVLMDEEHPAEGGVDIEARLPGRREQGLSLLSGGERSLTAVALIFSLLKVSPTPFCVMDEVDAMLDEANVGRFRELLLELSQDTQFIIITHNRNTVQAADVIYGVTMGRDSASQVISLKLDEVSEELTR